MQTYRYIFHRLYSWNLRAWGESDLPQYNVCLWLSLTLVVNLLSVAELVGADLSGFSRYAILLPLAVSVFAHYAYFVRGGLYQSLAAEFANVQTSILRNGAVVWLYALGSFALFFGLLHLGSRHPAA